MRSMQQIQEHICQWDEQQRKLERMRRTASKQVFREFDTWAINKEASLAQENKECLERL